MAPTAAMSQTVRQVEADGAVVPGVSAASWFALGLKSEAEVAWRRFRQHRTDLCPEGEDGGERMQCHLLDILQICFPGYTSPSCHCLYNSFPFFSTYSFNNNDGLRLWRVS